MRVDADHSELDVEGDGEPDWGCEVLDVVSLADLDREAPEDRLRRGLELMASGRFWEAHEVLEPAWHSSTGPERERLALLIRCCAAAVHVQRGRPESAARIAEGAAATAPDERLGALLKSCREDPLRIPQMLRSYASALLGHER